MPIPLGTCLGPYEILAPLGVGGMGEVYRARDTRLGREVAVKVLPERFAADAERVARFQREAQLLASLNHPNIAIIHGLEEGPASARALVMELVEGPTLADIIAGSGLLALGSGQNSGLSGSPGPRAQRRRGRPLDEALPIAKQIADALEAAHERGIVHRDLKPANIKVRPDGTVKVLDFGLAKLTDPNGSNDPNAPNASQSPTLSVQATMAGTLLGTAAYMSPEQARGKPVDRRADIWAFGCVLYEMLTGAQTFATGETLSDTVAAILKNEPDWSALPDDTPVHIRTLLRRCLQKDPQKRLPHIGVARLEIEEAAMGGDGGLGGFASVSVAADRSWDPASGIAAPTLRASRRRERLAWASGLALATLVAAGAVAWSAGSTPPDPEVRLEINTPPTSDAVSLALSPDGRRVVFEAVGDGGSHLWLRPMDAVSSRPLPGTERGSRPFWSPDSRSVGFFADGALKRIDIEHGTVQTLVNTGSASPWAAAGRSTVPSCIPVEHRVLSFDCRPRAVSPCPRRAFMSGSPPTAYRNFFRTDATSRFMREAKRT